MTATQQRSVATGSLAWEPPLADRPRRVLNGWRWILLGVVLVLVAIGATVKLPYYSLSPGKALAIGDLIEVSEGSPAFPPDGELLLTTVSLRQVTAFGAVAGWLRSDVEVVHEDFLFPPSVEDTRAFNLALMSDSKATAALVALKHLGYDITESGQGALVLAVEEGFPAHRVLETGDVIVKVDGAKVTTSAEAVTAIGSKQAGDRLDLTVLSLLTDEFRPVSVNLAARDDGSPILGVQLQTYQADFGFPFEVTIDSGSIGGPSAGLAFTLAVLDYVTPGELTGGRVIAVTGTISPDGMVGPVGGVAQKAVAVRRSGAALFLVPSLELETARRFAGDGVRVEAVDTLSQALAVLAEFGGNALDLASAAPAA
jgi:PDZ domain-containing protein